MPVVPPHIHMTINFLAKPMDAVLMSLFLREDHSDLDTQALGGDGAIQIERMS